MVDSIGAKPVIAFDRSVAPIAASATAKAATTVAKDQGGDTAAVTLTSIASDAAQTPTVDTERVARIRRAIADGTFPIYPAQIADRLIALKMEWSPTSDAA